MANGPDDFSAMNAQRLAAFSSGGGGDGGRLFGVIPPCPGFGLGTGEGLMGKKIKWSKGKPPSELLKALGFDKNSAWASVQPYPIEPVQIEQVALGQLSSTVGGDRDDSFVNRVSRGGGGFGPDYA